MEKDRLESFITKNRQELDYRMPPKGLWDKISRTLAPVSQTSHIRYWQVAAVVFFVFTMGLLLKNYLPANMDGNNNLIVEEFSTTENYYFDVIEEKENILTSYLEKFPELEVDFKKDLKELSINYKTLKLEFERTGSINVLSALIKNLQLQQDLLNNQLEVIKLIEKENENVSI